MIGEPRGVNLVGISFFKGDIKHVNPYIKRKEKNKTLYGLSTQAPPSLMHDKIIGRNQGICTTNPKIYLKLMLVPLVLWF